MLDWVESVLSREPRYTQHGNSHIVVSGLKVCSYVIVVPHDAFCFRSFAISRN